MGNESNGPLAMVAASGSSELAFLKAQIITADDRDHRQYQPHAVRPPAHSAASGKCCKNAVWREMLRHVDVLSTRRFCAVSERRGARVLVGDASGRARMALTGSGGRSSQGQMPHTASHTLPLLKGELAAGVVEVLEAGDAVARGAHHLAGLAHVAAAEDVRRAAWRAPKGPLWPG